MEIMKRILILAAALLPLSLLCARAEDDPAGTISYALPQTSISFEVSAVQEKFFAGPYAKYAQKYLGVQARQEDATTFTVSSVKITPYIEADQNSRYVVTFSGKGAASSFLKMTSQGLVAVTDGNFGEESAWKFTLGGDADFSSKGVSSNFTSTTTTLYQKSSSENAAGKIAVQQDMVVEKSPEKKAQEAANMIFSLRKTRIQIVTGDTDATYSGEAMASVLSELERLEAEYMTLFVGYTQVQTQTKTFDVIPDNSSKSHVFVAFRLSDTEGLLPSDNMGGKPYIVELKEQTIGEAHTDLKSSARKGGAIMYRIPAICTLKLTDGVNCLLQTRVPVYQYGVDKSYPIQ